MKFLRYGVLLILPSLLGSGIASQAQTSPPPKITIAPRTTTRQTPALEVLKMVQSGIETNVTLAFVDSCAPPFGLTADNVLDFRAKGVPSEVLAAMLRHDARILESRRFPPFSPRTPPGQSEIPEGQNSNPPPEQVEPAPPPDSMIPPAPAEE